MDASGSASARRAGRLLHRLFAPLDLPIAFRFWDGSAVQVGDPRQGGCAVVFPSRREFRRLLLRPTPMRFGEAYIEGGLDIEGDIFAAMAVAHRLESVRPSLGVKLAALVEALRP